MANTWTDHPPARGKARVWKSPTHTGEFPWYYRYPSGCGSIARSWEDAMKALEKGYKEGRFRWPKVAL